MRLILKNTFYQNDAFNRNQSLSQSFSVLKKRIALSLLFIIYFVIQSFSQTVTVAGGGAITCPQVPTAIWTTPPAGVSFSNWSRGAGVTCVSVTNGLAGQGFNGVNAAASIAANAYFNVTISADAATTFTLNNVIWATQVSAGTCNFDVYYSNNGGPLTAFGATGTSTTSNTFTGAVNVAAGTSITLFLIPSGATASTTTVRWLNNTGGNPSSINLTVNSSTAATNYIMTNGLGTILNSCGGNFYDSGGSGSTYLNNENDTVTFCAPAGQYLYFNFSQFYTELGFDTLYVYNGSSVASPLFYILSGNLSAPFVISSSLGGCITFRFRSDGSFSYAGWAAAITCSATPPPSNDYCSTAQPVTPDGTCISGTTLNSNDSWTGNVGCQSAAGSHQDVWYSFVATGTQAQIAVTTSGSFIGNAEIILVRGTCGGTLTLVGSQCGASPINATFTGLTIGTTYYYTISNTPGGTAGPFQTCVTTTMPSVPTNDEPCNATPLSVGTSCVYTQATNINATATTTSITPLTPTCSTYAGGDVWFTAIVPASGILTFDSQAGTMTDGAMAVYTGTCNALTQVACNDDGTGLMPQISSLSLTPGSTVWIRFWSYNNNNNGTFGICVTSFTPTTNDEPCNAQALPAVTTTCNYTTSTTINATSSPSSVPPPSCVTTPRPDVWFSVIVPSTGAITVNTQSGTMTDGVMALYQGACGALTEIACDDNGIGMPQLTETGLTPGSTVWIRVWGYNTANSGTFGICVTTFTPPPPLSNDNPCNATTLNVTSTCNYTTFTTIGATNSSGVSAPSCGGTPNGDIWFQVTVPPSGSLFINTQALGLSDGAMAVYSGTCNSLIQVGCDDDGGTELMPALSLSGLAAGSTLWVRFWAYGTSAPGTFNICITSPPSCNNSSAAGNTCQTSTAICNFSGYCGNTSATYTADYWPELFTAFDNCLGGGTTIDNNSFISFVPTATTATFNLWVTSSLYGYGIQMMFYEGGCGSGPVTCHGGYNNITGVTSITATSLIPGNTYYLMIDGVAGDVCDYVLDVANGVSGMNITNSLTADASSSINICSGYSVNLTANGGNGVYSWSPNIGLSTTSGNAITATPPTTTTYTVTSIGTTFGCATTITSQITINVQDPLTAPVANSVSYCQDALASPLTASGIGLIWFTVPTGGTGTATAPIPSTTTAGTTNYWVAQSNPGCGIGPRTLVTVTVSGSSAPIFSLPTSICSGATVPILPTTSNNGISGNWSPSTISNTISNTYVFTPTSGACLTPVSYNITVYDPPITYPHGTNPSCSTICNGSATVDVVGGTPPYSYSWSNGSNTQAISNLCVGTYNITVTDSHGCTSNAFTPVTNNCINIQSILVNSCTGNEWNEEMVFFQTGQNPIDTTGMIVSWPTVADSWHHLCSNPAYIANANATITGGGSLLPVPANGIIPANANVVLITSNSLSTPVANWSNLNGPVYALFQCAGNNNGHFSNNNVSPNPLIISFSNGCSQSVSYSGSQIGSDGSYVNFSPSGTATYLNYGCTIPFNIQSAQVVLTAPTVASPITNSISYCQGVAAVPLTATGTSLLWYISATGGTGASTPPTPPTSNSGVFNYWVSQTIGLCESPRSMITVNVNANPIVNINSTNPSCSNLCTGTAAASVTAGTTPYSYIWSNNAITSSITSLCTGNYSVIVTDASGCTVQSASFTITAPSPVTPTFNSNPLICVGTTGAFPTNSNVPVINGSWTPGIINTSSANTNNYIFTPTIGTCATTSTVSIAVLAVSHISVTQASCDSFLWRGTMYFSSGNYLYNYMNANGCASTDTLHLTINTSSHTATTQTACGSYSWHGTTYTISGNYLYNYTNANGCASTDTLHLTIKQATISTETITSCDSLRWHGVLYTSSTTTPTWTTTNAVGCDSVVTLNLTINSSTHAATTQSACGSYSWHGTTYTISGNYLYNYTNANGCASTDTLHLTIKQPTSSTETITSCDSLRWHGVLYTSSTTTPTWTTTNAAGCDSVVTLNLTINTSTHTATTQSACGSYSWHGTTYTISGNYLYNYTNATGCASTDTLHLTIKQPTSSIETITSCDSLRWHGVLYTSSTNTPTWTTTNAAGCDSVVTLNLTINTSTHTATTQSACGSYSWHGTTYTISGNYLYNYTNANGCASSDTLHLTIKQPTSSTETITSCDSLRWHGVLYTSSTNTPTWTTTNAAGCDSVVTLNLTIKTSTHTATTQSACGSYSWHGTTYTISGNYLYNYTNTNGCASTDTLHLTIKQPTSSTETITSCDSLRWHGVLYTSSTTTPTWTTTNAAGCDSVVTLNVTINSSTHAATTQSACGSYSWQGTTYTISGNYLYNYTNANGCASTDTLHLTISTGVPVVTTTSTCVSYTWNGTTYTNSGTYLYNYPSGSGCTTTDTLHLTIKQATTSTETFTSCDSLRWHGGLYTSSTTTPTWTTTNAAGCDSVVTLNLTINTSTHTATTQSACGSYSWHGTTYTISGNYLYNYTNATGCASTDTLHLTIKQPTSSTETITSCDSLRWHGVLYTSSTNTPTWTTTNAAGCDSVVTLNLTINSSTHAATTQSACGSYSWHGTTYTISGNYLYNYTNANGCASSDTLYLTISTGVPVVTTTSTCVSYTWNGTTYTNSGTYLYNYPSGSGCTTTDTLHLTIKQATISTETITSCDSLRWHGVLYTSSTTTPTWTTTNAVGCDSVVTLNLTINSSTHAATTQSACGSYSWHGTTYTISGNYLYNYTNTNGCASSDTLHLTISTGVPVVTTTSTCVSYTWNGTTYTNSGTYLYNYPSGSGCTTTDTLHLTIKQPTSSIETITSCDSLRWHGVLYTSSTNTPTWTTTNAAGCDSVVTLNLTINTSTHAATTQSSCGSYSWNGTTYTISGNYLYNYTNTNGCASTDTLHLTIKQPTSSTETITSCDSLRWHGVLYTSSTNTPTWTTTNAAGCDSVVTLNLTINSSTHTATTQSSCGSYSWNGTTYTISGNYLYNYTNTNGCASTDTLHLTIKQATTSTETITSCDSLRWHGVLYTSSTTTPTWTTTNAAGCDSVVTLNLTINSSTHTATTQSACGSYSWNGTTYTIGGNYLYNYTNTNGCASTDTLHLTIKQATISTETITSCDSLRWHGVLYTSSTTTPTWTTTNAAGCDSLVTLNLTINTSTHTATIQTACGSYSWHGTTYTISGNYLYNYTNANGCASTDTLHLTIKQATTSTVTITSCDSLRWHGVLYTSSTTTPTWTTTNAAGCDSVVTLNLTINSSTHTATTQSACGSYSWHGTTYTISGNYLYNYTNTNGCASSDTLHLTIKQATTSTETITSCDSLRWHGVLYTSSTNTPTWTTTNAAGCDSVVTLNLTINTSTHTATTQSACGSYSWHGTTYTISGNYLYNYTNATGCASSDTLHLTISTGTHHTAIQTSCDSLNWNGMVYYNSGSYLYNYFDANGCASTDTLILTINHSTRSITNITICSAQLPYNWNGNTYLSTGNYLITLTNSYGCDSMAMLHLLINPSPEPPTVNSPVNYCQYDQTEELSASGLYNLIWYSSPTDNTGSSNQPIPNANIPGTYLYYVSQSNGTCVSPRSLITVHINPKPSIGNDKEYKICFGATINLQLLYLGNNLNTTWTLNNIPVINTTNVSTAGNYQVIAENTYGCYDTANVRLIVQPKVIANAGNDENVMSNVPFQLHGSGGVQYLWTPSNYLNNPSIQNPTAIITNTMDFILTVKDDIGCADSDTVKFRILDGPTFYVPNAFTPDGDGLNDIFRPVYVGIQKLNYFRVYDRYGLIVYETNIIGNGWNGFFRSKPQIMGNYVFVVSAVDKYNNTIVKKGNVMLIR